MLMRALAIGGTILVLSTYSLSEITTDSARSDVQTPRSWLFAGVELTQGHYGFGERGFGGGLFFRLGEQWAIGLRGGFKSESYFFEAPIENSWRINPSLQFIPVAGSAGMISVGLGAGLSGGVRRGKFLYNGFEETEYEGITYSVLSETGEIQLAFFVTRSIGTTLTTFINMNREQNQSGFLIGIQLRVQ